MNVPEADYFSNPGYSQSDMKQAWSLLSFSTG